MDEILEVLWGKLSLAPDHVLSIWTFITHNYLAIIKNLQAFGLIPLIYILERLFPTRSVRWLPKGWCSDLFHTYEPWIRAAVVSWFVLKLTPLMPDVYPRGIAASLSPWAGFTMALVVSEVGFYFIHRATHALPWLWEFHQVHHSSVEYYSLMTSRFHILDLALFETPNIVLFAWLGIPAEVLMVFGFFRGFMDRYGHSNINGPYFTGYLIGSPHFHAWHHSTLPQAINKNFGRDTVFMDYIFGTAYYPKGIRAYGFGDPTYSSNYFVQQVTPFVTLLRKLRVVARNLWVNKVARMMKT